MTNTEKAYEAVELKIVELNLKPGSKLAMICPEGWTPTQIGMFVKYANESFERRDWKIELICFPYGLELFTISPDAGFK